MRVTLPRASLVLTVLVAAVAGLAAPALAKDSADRLEARLRGFNEVPPVSTAASGNFKATINTVSNSISYELSYSGLEGDVRQAHIHFGQKGVAGGISIWLCQTATNVDPTGLSPTCPQSGTVTGLIQAANVIGPTGQGIAATEFAEVLNAIRAGVTYANVHSSKFLGGEIRGQIRDDD
jgi:CHRD domain